jgi:hypothetical protein
MMKIKTKNKKLVKRIDRNFKMKWYWSFLLNFDTICVITFLIVLIYFIITTRNKKFKYIDPDDYYDDEEDEEFVSRKPKQKKKKPKINKHEERCRDIFQKIYQRKFKSVRPDWLKNPVTGRNLELDGFCEKIRTKYGLGIAFEYDGEQHAKYNKHFHRSGPAEFHWQVKKDEWKDLQCERRGVALVRIPHFVDYNDLEKYITKKLYKMQIHPSQLKHNQPIPRNNFKLSGLYS